MCAFVCLSNVLHSSSDFYTYRYSFGEEIMFEETPWREMLEDSQQTNKELREALGRLEKRQIGRMEKLEEVAKAANHLKARYLEWVREQYNEDGSCKTTWIGDPHTELLIKKLDLLEKK